MYDGLDSRCGGSGWLACHCGGDQCYCDYYGRGGIAVKLAPQVDPEEERMLSDFRPHMVYTMRRSTLQKLLLRTPRPAFWMGRKYTIRSKHIGAGIYEVTGQFNDEGAT